MGLKCLKGFISLTKVRNFFRLLFAEGENFDNTT